MFLLCNCTLRHIMTVQLHEMSNVIVKMRRKYTLRHIGNITWMRYINVNVMKKHNPSHSQNSYLGLLIIVIGKSSNYTMIHKLMDAN